MAPHKLTAELMPLLRTAADVSDSKFVPRVVFVASLGHISGTDFDAKRFLKHPDKGGCPEKRKKVLIRSRNPIAKETLLVELLCTCMQSLQRSPAPMLGPNTNQKSLSTVFSQEVLQATLDRMHIGYSTSFTTRYLQCFSFLHHRVLCPLLELVWTRHLLQLIATELILMRMEHPACLVYLSLDKISTSWERRYTALPTSFVINCSKCERTPY